MRRPFLPESTTIITEGLFNTTEELWSYLEELQNQGQIQGIEIRSKQIHDPFQRIANSNEMRLYRSSYEPRIAQFHRFRIFVHDAPQVPDPSTNSASGFHPQIATVICLQER